MREAGLFEATADFARLNEPDAILICVPTPLGRHREPDLYYVEATTRSIAAALRSGQLIVRESTTYPGTTREVVKPILEACKGRGPLPVHGSRRGARPASPCWAGLG